jgi:hypothetical protein
MVLSVLLAAHKLLLLLLLLLLLCRLLTHPRTIVTGSMNMGNTSITAILQDPQQQQEQQPQQALEADIAAHGYLLHVLKAKHATESTGTSNT